VLRGEISVTCPITFAQRLLFSKFAPRRLADAFGGVSSVTELAVRLNEGELMFTVLSIFSQAAIGYRSDEANAEDRGLVTEVSDDELRTVILHARQDIKTLCFISSAIMRSLGIIADLLLALLLALIFKGRLF